jgi:hypothetical protein
VRRCSSATPAAAAPNVPPDAPPYPRIVNDDELLRRFRAGDVPRALWTHEAHVRTAYLLVRSLAPGAALDAARDGIRRLNARNGVPDTTTGGYHETITRAWLRIAGSLSRRWDATGDSRAFLDAHPFLRSPALLTLYYSAPLLGAPEARAGWVEPDIAPLPPIS